MLANQGTTVHTAEPLVPGPSCLEVKIASATLKTYKSPGSKQIPAELIRAEGEILLPEIHKFTNYIWRKEELPDSGRSIYYCTSPQKG
jgi:hypothetical protein